MAGEEETIRELLKVSPKGLTIEEVSKKLTLNRATAAKYLNAFVLTGQAEMRMLGSAKLFSLTQRVPLTNLLSLSSDLILILDEDLFIQEVNEPFLTFFGTTKEEVKGSQIGHSPLAAHITDTERSSIERALEGESSTREVRFDLLDPNRYFRMKSIPLTFENGARAVGIFLDDVTEMKTYQQALEQRVSEKTRDVVRAKDFAENLISTANAMIIGLDTKGRVTVFNQAAEEMTGYSRNEVMGKHVIDLIVPEERFPEFRRALNILIAGNRAKHFESPILTKAGNVRYISWNNNALLEDGKVTATISFGIDVTEHRQALEQLKESQRALSTLMGNLPGMAYRYKNDTGWPMEFVSEGSADLTGYLPHELVGSDSVAYGDLIHQGDRKRVWDATQAALKDHTSFQVIYRILTATGAERWVWEQGLGVYDPDGELLAIEGFIADITEQKTAEEIIRKANKQVALLTSITRHDIINQINSLQGYIAILKQDITQDNTVRMLDTIDKIAATVLRQIIFTRDYQNVGAEPPRWIVIRKTVDHLLQTIDRGQVQIAIDTGDAEIYADPLIEKVFFNLIDNSLRHGERVTTIRISCETNGQDLLIVYEDNGIGIPNDDKEMIFDRGFGKNTGYGLFLIREILAITGFSITENGIPGKGARFVIRVPQQSGHIAGQPSTPGP